MGEAGERGADVADAEEADPADGRDTLRPRIHCGGGAGRQVEHGRSHDETLQGCVWQYRGIAATPRC